ncbi:MAG TPA: LuxR C-terminal-related transcriptional regulator [Steroidobacteraceae bacterium]
MRPKTPASSTAPEAAPPSTVSRGSIGRSIKLLHGLTPQHIIATAPAGFGKTTLLRELREQALASGAKVAWFTVLSEHEDAATFVSAIVESLQELGCGLSLAVHKDAVPGHATGLRELCREIAAQLARLPHPTVLFIDDYHLVRGNEATGLFVEELAHAASANFQIVLASRSQANFSTVRLRLDSRLQQLTSRELQFSYEEARQFYSRLHGLQLTPAQLAKIIARTDGWAAGLQLVALALARSPRPDDVIDALSGDFHDITEYLARYVIDGLASELLDFLLDTSVLDRLNAELCAALTRNVAAGSLLAQAQEMNLFVRPLDETRTWFAYHQLFRDFLKTQLNARDPERARELHRRASEWYAEHRLPHRAIEHALSAGDHDGAAQLVESFAQERIDIGGMADVERWINMIPAEVVSRHPRFHVFKGWALCHICKYNEAAEILRTLERDLATQSGEDTEQIRERQYELAVLKAVNALAGDNVAEALESLPEDPPEQSKHMRRLRAMKSNVEGACHIFMSRFDAAERALTRAYTLHLGSGSLNGVVYALCYLGYVHLLSGPLAEASAKFEQAEQAALARSGQDSFCCALPRALHGLVADDRDEVDLAQRSFMSHLTPIEEGAYIGFRRAVFLRLARILMDRGEIRQADEVLHRLLRSCDEIYLERTQLLIDLERARQALRCGELSEAVRLLNRLPAARDVGLFEAWQSDICEPAMVRAQYALLAGDAARALQLLEPLKQLADSARRLSSLQELLVLEARAAWALEQRDSAANALMGALELARRTGRLRACADWRDEVLSLAEALHLENGANPAAATALADLRRTGSSHSGDGSLAPAGNRATSVSASSAGEALSARELVVLQLVARGMRNKQTAAELNISEHTVRWHLRNVLEKLNVTNRMEAVNAARELGLLDR